MAYYTKNRGGVRWAGSQFSSQRAVLRIGVKSVWSAEQSSAMVTLYALSQIESVNEMTRAAISDIAKEIHKNVRKRTPRVTETLYDSIKYDVYNVKGAVPAMSVFTRDPVSPFVEIRRRPGEMPPVYAIEEWMRTLMAKGKWKGKKVSDVKMKKYSHPQGKTVNVVAFRIATDIAQHGTFFRKPKHRMFELGL